MSLNSRKKKTRNLLDQLRFKFDNERSKNTVLAKKRSLGLLDVEQEAELATDAADAALSEAVACVSTLRDGKAKIKKFGKGKSDAEIVDIAETTLGKCSSEIARLRQVIIAQRKMIAASSAALATISQRQAQQTATFTKQIDDLQRAIENDTDVLSYGGGGGGGGGDAAAAATSSAASVAITQPHQIETLVASNSLNGFFIGTCMPMVTTDKKRYATRTAIARAAMVVDASANANRGLAATTNGTTTSTASTLGTVVHPAQLNASNLEQQRQLEAVRARTSLGSFDAGKRAVVTAHRAAGVDV